MVVVVAVAVALAMRHMTVKAVLQVRNLHAGALLAGMHLPLQLPLQLPLPLRWPSDCSRPYSCRGADPPPHTPQACTAVAIAAQGGVGGWALRTVHPALAQVLAAGLLLEG